MEEQEDPSTLWVLSVPRPTAGQTRDWNMVLNEFSLLLLDYFLQMPINYRNQQYPFLIICSLSKLITRTCWLALWALRHVWYVVTLKWLKSFYSNYLMENCKGHQILLSRTSALQCLATLRDVMLSMTSKSAAFTKKNLTRTGVPGVPVK